MGTSSVRTVRLARRHRGGQASAGHGQLGQGSLAPTALRTRTEPGTATRSPTFRPCPPTGSGRPGTRPPRLQPVSRGAGLARGRRGLDAGRYGMSASIATPEAEPAPAEDEPPSIPPAPAGRATAPCSAPESAPRALTGRAASPGSEPTVSAAAFVWDPPEPEPTSPSSPARNFLRSSANARPRLRRGRRPSAWPRRRARPAGAAAAGTLAEGVVEALGPAGPPDHRPGRALVGDEVQLRGVPGRLRHLVRRGQRDLRHAVGARRVHLAPARRAERDVEPGLERGERGQVVHRVPDPQLHRSARRAQHRADHGDVAPSAR